MKKIAAIVCNNGLGHLKRVLSVLERAKKEPHFTHRVDLFVNLHKLKSLSHIVDTLQSETAGIEYHDVQSEDLEYEEEFLAKYKNKLQEADFIWSDNLTFPLKFRKEVFLTGSFLWLDVLPETQESKKEKEILSKNKPIMISNKYFATPGVKNFTILKGVGMYEYWPVNFVKPAEKKLLISCGKSRSGNAYFQNSLNQTKNVLQELPLDIEAYIEPSFFHHFKDYKNVFKADFSEHMFSDITAAIIRPGVGTICDVLSKGGRIFTVCDNDNFEIDHNAGILKNLQVGERAEDILDALNRSLGYLENPKMQESHRDHLQRLEFNGIDLTAREIVKITS